MPKTALTDIAIRALKPPDKGQRTYWDRNLSGFGCRLSQGGSKTFVVRIGGNARQTTIGRYGIMTLSDARASAKRLLAEATLGKTQFPVIAFSNVVARFLAACEQKNSPRTTRDYRRLLNRHFSFGRTPLGDITRAEITRRIDKLRNTPAEQNHALVVVRVLFRWAVRQEYIDRSPVEYMTPPAKTTSRDRILTDSELVAVYHHALSYPFPYGAIVVLCILTGQRRSEIGALKWDWIDRENQTITLPALTTKHKKHQHTFPYGDMAAEIIAGIPQTGDYLFPAGRTHVRGKPTTVFNSWAKAKPAFDRELEGVDHFTLHDLRRTFATSLQRLSVRLEVTEALLGHVSGTRAGVVGIYQRHHWLPEMREAVAKLDAHIASLINS